MSAPVTGRPATIELPETGDSTQWTEDQKALLDAAGLVVRKKGKDPLPAPRSTVVAFLAHCRRTGLDPIARQIYAIERGGKWGIQVSIDGFRLVAERSRQYAGQLPVQWTADGQTWVDVWVKSEPPAAVRVGVLRRDFDEPLMAVARFEAYAVYEAEWEGEYPNRRKTGRKTLSEMWRKMHAEQIAKVAEALALRKAFPMELSGLYTAEEMDQAFASDADPAPRAPRGKAASLEAGTRSAQRDPLPDSAKGDPLRSDEGDVFYDRLGDATTLDELQAVWREVCEANLGTEPSLVQLKDQMKEDLGGGRPSPVGPPASEQESHGEPAAELFPCARCGVEGVAVEEGAICDPCEVEVQAEIAAEGGEQA